VEWTKANLVPDGGGGLTSLVIGGCSAGSIGAQIWAPLLLEEFGGSSDGSGSVGGGPLVASSVIADSYAGVFPPGSQGPLIQDFGMCDVQPPLFEGDDLVQKCSKGELSLSDVMNYNMPRFPSVPFSHINSKSDWCQEEFYAGVALTLALTPPFTKDPDQLFLSDAEYCADATAIFKDYSANHPNYVNFAVTSDQHCYTPYSLLYTADTTGTQGAGVGGATTLVDWLSTFGADNRAKGGSVESECDGPALDEAEWTGNDYCDASQVGKEFAFSR